MHGFEGMGWGTGLTWIFGLIGIVVVIFFVIKASRKKKKKEDS